MVHYLHRGYNFGLRLGFDEEAGEVIELWLVVSTVCWSYLSDGWVESPMAGRYLEQNCVQQVSISTFQPVGLRGETVYRVTKLFPCYGHIWVRIDESESNYFSHPYTQRCSLCSKRRKWSWVEEE